MDLVFYQGELPQRQYKCVPDVTQHITDDSRLGQVMQKPKTEPGVNGNEAVPEFSQIPE
jgi:hypothetical protein